MHGSRLRSTGGASAADIEKAVRPSTKGKIAFNMVVTSIFQ
jgi:hypothetical protein